MKKNYKYLIILAFILNFTNIYSQSNNYIYTLYNESIGTLYIDKQLLESTANALSQYLGPLAPIIVENLPILISFFALFFMSRRFINIFNSQLPESEKLIASLVMSIPLTFFFWPFVIPILIIAFIIKVFRIGKSKLESFKETLGKINSGLKDIFSRAISNIKDFNKDTNKILKDIKKLDNEIKDPYIRDLLNRTEKNIKTLKNMIFYVLEKAENGKLTLPILKIYSLKFNNIYNITISDINQLNEIIDNMLKNPPLLRRLGNRIFRTNKFTSNYLNKLINKVKGLNTILNTIHEEGQRTFKYLDELLSNTENIINKSENDIRHKLYNLKGILNNIPLSPKDRNKIQKSIEEIERGLNAIPKSNMSTFQIEEKLVEINKQLNRIYKLLKKFEKHKKQVNPGKYIKNKYKSNK
jgi:hypothetical protein